MKIIKILLTILFLICVAVAGVVIVSKDSTPPELNVPDTPLQLGCDTNSMLQDVTARDDKDGNITDQVFIENALQDYIQQNGSITYVVMDNAGNTTKQVRKVDLSAASSPMITDNQSLTITQTETNIFNIHDFFSAVDACGNDYSSQMYTDSVVDTSKPGKYPITIKLNNNEFFTYDKEIIVEPLVKVEFAIQLKEKEITLPIDTEYDPKDNIESITDPTDTQDKLLETLEIDTKLNTSKKGSYKVTYTVTNSRDEKTKAVCTIKVE
ncbi:MAG: DUF5011 domain-containing protein [Anaerorhabdus sp.]